MKKILNTLTDIGMIIAMLLLIDSPIHGSRDSGRQVNEKTDNNTATIPDDNNRMRRAR